jgi:hypothetical protein
LTDLFHPKEIAMSFREKIAWSCLLSTLAVYLPYFTFILSLAITGELSFGHALGAFILAVIAQIVIQSAFAIGIAIRNKEVPADERDRAIDNRAVKIAYCVLVASCFVTIPHVYIYVLIAKPLWIETISVAAVLCQVLLFCFVLAEVTRFSMQAIGYRRGV